MRQSIEQRKVASLAREYRERGYRVFAQLPGYPAPERYGSYVPDLIVERGDEKIVIEVVSSMSMKDQHQAIVELAKRAASEKGMRFDLVVTNPRPLKKDKAARAVRQLKRLEIDLIHVLDFAVESKQFVVFFVVAGLLVDHLVIGLWEEHVNQPLDQPDGHDPIRLASVLRERKVISESAYTFINEIWKMRNICLHGTSEFRQEIMLNEAVEKLKSLAASYAGVRDDFGDREKLS